MQLQDIIFCYSQTIIKLSNGKRTRLARATGASGRQNPKIMEIIYEQEDLQVLQRHHHVQMQVRKELSRGNPAKLLKGINPL